MARLKIRGINIDEELCEAVRAFIKSQGRTQVWITERLKEKGVDITQTSLSNRINGIFPFDPDQAKAIKSIMKKYKQ
jgi:hypothetical protein